MRVDMLTFRGEVRFCVLGVEKFICVYVYV